MKATILAVGDEILVGQTVNTNATWISEKLSEIGIEVVWHLSVADTMAAIQNALAICFEQADLIIMTGGLGPTKDDITKKAIASYYQVESTFSRETYAQIIEIFKRRNIPLTQAHHDQCYMPSNATLMTNKMGTAPGMWFQEGSKFLASMPGVPYEMQYIMTYGVLRKIQALNRQIYRKKTIRTVGIGETSIAEIIEPRLEQHDVGLAYLPSPGGVRIRLYKQGNGNAGLIEQSLARAVDAVKDAIAPYIYGFDDEELEAHIGKLLMQKKIMLGTAESCTGGFIAHRITSIAGSSRYFKGSIIAYCNEIKRDVLAVTNEILNTHGAVSQETVEQMVRGGIKSLSCDVAIAVSGISGPGGGTVEKPVGTVWISVGDHTKVISKRFLFTKDRIVNIKYTAVYALDMLRKFLIGR
ncbi:MAG: competence/damage-inducible protein A [Saprospiraceae bacterium]|nr:competence/damage-inducible protein A [Saprospiraceae bacterium]